VLNSSLALVPRFLSNGAGLELRGVVCRVMVLGIVS